MREKPSDRSGPTSKVFPALTGAIGTPALATAADLRRSQALACCSVSKASILLPAAGFVPPISRLPWPGLARRQLRAPIRLGVHAQAVDEDIDQPHHAFLPAGLVVHVAHADEGTQQVLRADVRPYLAGRDRAIEQGAKGFGQGVEGKRHEIRRAVNGER